MFFLRSVPGLGAVRLDICGTRLDSAIVAYDAVSGEVVQVGGYRQEDHMVWDRSGNIKPQRALRFGTTDPNALRDLEWIKEYFGICVV